MVHPPFQFPTLLDKDALDTKFCLLDKIDNCQENVNYCLR